ncbi:11651_t:CDS:2 [Cetraspora pellucida]|uniref:11651_t:CDS:1 n=1 Tax=Cetraspora pellucida TaxID=1433469 RepID=A0ACA9KE56_9GLOM|nr:11651_t:CDS:2 [Cetraspora pellucida]
MYPGRKYEQQYGVKSNNPGYPGSQAPPPQQPAPLPLPPGWITLYDPASRKHYFVNQATGISQWDPPPPNQQYYSPPSQPPPNQQYNNPPSQPPPPYQQFPAQGYVMHQNPNIPPPSNYVLSNCTGNKKALLIGINYFNTKFELKGCINDVRNVKRFLIELYGFREDNMVILTDDQKDPTRLPYKRNIITAMQWLVRDARPNDSGHGGQIEDIDGDEDDGYDETILPLDHDKSTGGQIIDDEMHAIMVRPLQPGVRLTAIFDSCHSGTALDLPYIYSTQGVVKEYNILSDGGSTIMNAGMSYLRGDLNGIKTSIVSFGKKAMSGNKVAEQNKVNKSSPADDSQTSADANEAGQNTGAMSFAFITAMKKMRSENRTYTYQQLLTSIRDTLAGKYSQKPQLST